MRSQTALAGRGAPDGIRGSRVAAQLGFKQRVRLYETAPERIRAARVPPLFLPLGFYWAACAALCYAVLSGSLPIARWFDGEPARERKTTRHSAARRVRARPTPAPPPQLDVLVVPQTVAQPSNPPDPAPIAALATPWTDPAELAAPPVEAEKISERPPPDRPVREPEPVAHQRPAPEREPILDRKPEIARPSEPTPGPPVGSCEAAIASHSERIDLEKGGRLPPDLTRESYASLLERGDYFSHCDVPDDMTLEICAAVQNGRALGITIVTRPASARVRSCVSRAVQSLRFPAHPRLDVTRTRFDALR